MIANADAIVDPGTMVVHFNDAAFADTAMMGPGWLVSLATAAEAEIGRWRWSSRVVGGWYTLRMILGQWLRIGWNGPRIGRHGLKMTPNGHAGNEGKCSLMEKPCMRHDASVFRMQTVPCAG